MNSIDRVWALCAACSTSTWPLIKKTNSGPSVYVFLRRRPFQGLRDESDGQN